MASLIKWHGGKHYLAPWIINKFPTEYVHYVEPYCGGCSVLFRLPMADRSEVINDLNGSVSAFWRVVRDSPKELETALFDVPFSELEFEQAKAVLAGECNDFTRALAFLIVNRMSRQGLCKSFATLTKNRTRQGVNEQASSWRSAKNSIQIYADRLRDVVVLCRPALKVIKSEDGPNTLFYLDPPYLQETRTVKDAYEHEMSASDHEQLLKALAKIKGKFVLSGYWSQLYQDFADRHGWESHSKEIDNKSSSAKQKQIKTEWIWVKR